MDIALSLGKEKMYDYVSAFGYGKATGVDYGGEAIGMLLPESAVKNGDLARISFGQTMPDKNNTNLAKTPLFTRFFANSRTVYIQYYRPRLCNKSSKISAFLLHASLTACF